VRLTRRLLEQRLQRVRARAQLARTSLSNVRIVACASRPENTPLPPLPSFPELRCGKRCDVENPQSPGRREAARTIADAALLLRRLGRGALEVRLLDISTGGCHLERAASLSIAEHVVTRLPGLEPLGATVAWANSRHAGLHFDRPLHPAVFELLLTRLGLSPCGYGHT
jgi:hypothetical protein